MLSFIDSLTALRRGRHSSLEARTSSRRLRHATPQVETLEKIISLSTRLSDEFLSHIYQSADYAHNVQQVATVVQANANGYYAFNIQYVDVHASQTLKSNSGRLLGWQGGTPPPCHPGTWLAC